MVYRRYYIQVVVRVILIVFTSLILAYFFLGHQISMIFWLFIVVLVYQSFDLIRYINKTNHYLANFLLTLKESDGGVMSNIPGDYSPISDLHGYFSEIREIIRNVKIEKEKQYHYIQYIIENVGVGIISFDSNGKIELSNQTARNLFRMPVLYKLRDLSLVSEGLDRFIRTLEPDKPVIYRLSLENEILHLSMRASWFVVDEKKITLVSFQDIRNALEDKELESWQKLIRVLTHEIMNSVTPLNTLTNTLKKLLMKDGKSKPASELNDELIQGLVDGLELIDERGKGLIHFVKRYRSLTQLPTPHFKKVFLQELCQGINTLFAEELKNNSIQLHIDIEKSLSVSADESLIEQVLINLIRNAVQALKNISEPCIRLHASKKEGGRVYLMVSDNGQGISDDLINHIFIPFFTTREGGSGIGLSLSRQIMRLHKGNISVQSKVGEGTTFILKF